MWATNASVEFMYSLPNPGATAHLLDLMFLFCGFPTGGRSFRGARGHSPSFGRSGFGRVGRGEGCEACRGRVGDQARPAGPRETASLAMSRAAARIRGYRPEPKHFTTMELPQVHSVPQNTRGIR